ncbi:UvrD-helicase domain-containing protein [Raoultibacter phocaeensis]|uniref:UvrD-helicase domain-containing protein n=1 Tax=Raoultibacter phocaeensis TaxID=2479841 RepID=UPI00111A6E2C|nr:ATP-dependent helicase [Raoultibacter phocaeensis]
MSEMGGGAYTATLEQAEAIAYDGNLVITARPGSGKTFVMVEKITAATRNLRPFQGIIAISFTNKASNELKERCARKGVAGSRSFFGTIDRFFISEIIVKFGGHLIRMPTDFEICKLCDHPEYGELSSAKRPLTVESEELLFNALRDGLIFLEVVGETALRILKRSQACRRYIKARYTQVFIDEYQDCGESQHGFFTELVAIGLVGTAVGDLDQAIYGFAGKKSRFLRELATGDSFQHMSITQNFRCHKSISDYSLKLLGIGVRGVPPEDKRVVEARVPGGEEQIARAICARLPGIMERNGVEHLGRVAILARTNRTLAKVAQSVDVPYRIATSTALEDHGSSQAKMLDDMLTSYFAENGALTSFVRRYFSEEEDDRQYRKALSITCDLFDTPTGMLRGEIDKMIELASMACYNERPIGLAAVLFCELGDPERLANDYSPLGEGEVNLMTLHKAKGLEFDIVFHLEAYESIMPMFRPQGPDPAETQQALNLHYVGITRAIKECYLVLGTTRTNSSGRVKTALPSPFLSKNGLDLCRRHEDWIG